MKTKMKFFERTYLLTLLLFLAFLNGCILMLTLYSYESRVEAMEQVCLSEQYTIRHAYENDRESSGGSDLILQTTYGNFYRKKGIALRFCDDQGKEMYSSLPAALTPPADGTLTHERTEEGVRYLLISESICDGALTLTYAKDVSDMDEEFRSLFWVYLGVSVASSTLLALLLHLVLRRLYSPLDRLRRATERLSGGDFSVRAEIGGGEDELSLLGAAFNRMADQISTQMTELKTTADQKQRMLDDLAHEMRTPLMSIHGYAEYIGTANITDEERIDATQYIMSESMRLRHISETLLDMAFVRENAITREPLACRSLLTSTLDRHLLQAQARGVTLQLKATSAVIWGDALLLELLLSNLTENAIKACRKDGVVELGCCTEEEATLLYVRDNGVGMTAEQIAHVTEPFYRTDPSRSRRDGGTGLGLALCARIAHAHGGELRFLSTPGQGCQACLSLPNDVQASQTVHNS